MDRQAELVYVERDTTGRIIAVSLHPRPGFEACRIHPGGSPESPDPLAEQVNGLAASDLAMARVLEDLIDLLIERNIIRFTDLPEGAREKLLRRRNLRARLQGLDLLDDEPDHVL